MVSTRTKGLNFCHEVRKILEGMGHEVDGPFYCTKFFGGKINVVHKDIFSVFDLISFYENRFIFHQVSTIENKATKIKAIQNKNMPGWIWCRVNEENSVGYDIWVIDGPIIEEKEMRYFIKKNRERK